MYLLMINCSNYLFVKTWNLLMFMLFSENRQFCHWLLSPVSYHCTYSILNGINIYGKSCITLNDKRIIQYDWQSILQRQLSILLKPAARANTCVKCESSHNGTYWARSPFKLDQWHLNHRCVGSIFFISQLSHGNYNLWEIYTY